MQCTKCEHDAVMHAAYSGAHLCDAHFVESVERRVRRRVREDGLVPRDATPEDPDTWVVGLSGGKDSVALTQILHETFAEDPRIEIVALTIHEGIEGYRDESVDACLELTDDLDIRHEVVSYAEEFGVEMDDVVEDDPEGMAACAYCGVFRRDLLEEYADEFGADKLLTGHNLDDEAQTALMNFLEGDVAQIAKHFDASLGPFDADDGPEREEQAEFVPRAKPLRDVPEKEVALYCHLRDLPAHITECPHASEAYRGEIQELIHGLEENHPGTRHSILAGYEELAAIVASEYHSDRADDFEQELGVKGIGQTVRAEWADDHRDSIRANPNGYAAPEKCLAAHLVDDDEPIHLEVCNASFEDNVTQRLEGAKTRGDWTQLLDPRGVCLYADGHRSTDAIQKLRDSDLALPTLSRALQMLGLDETESQDATSELHAWRDEQDGATVRGDVI